ncbi:MAG: HDOD domain-containing protein [Candidatus Omnitrophica bacterium]|nr:HDOD domain-containing protein [Candidatus Omnitrophota bacterium]
MRIEELPEFISQIEDLPTLPGMYALFREKIYDPKTSANDIARIISSDQAIASKILRIANSAFYGFMRRIDNIPHAIVIIGFNGIHHIVLNTAVLDMFKGNPQIPEFDMAKIWEHSLATATISKIIARRIGYGTGEEMFTAGLLHDIGKVIIYKYLPNEFKKIIRVVKEKNILIKEAETQVLGVDHTQFGSALLKQWNFPESLILTTTYHHEPVLAQDKRKAANIVHLADIICRSLEIGSGGDDKIPRLHQGVWENLGLDIKTVAQIVDEVDTELNDSSVFNEFLK